MTAPLSPAGDEGSPSLPPAGDEGNPKPPPLVVTEDMLAEEHDPSGGRADFEQGMSYAPPITLALIVLNVGMFAWQLSVGALENEHTIIAFGALSRSKILDGEFWRLGSVMVLHGGLDHLLSNMVALYVLGVGVEHAVGGTRTFWSYVLAGLVASMFSVVTKDAPSVGASGAVFGMMGTLIVFLWMRRREFDIRDKRIGWVLFVWASFTLLTGLASPFIDNAAHLGGLVGGALLGLVLAPRARPTVRQFRRPGRARVRPLPKVR